MNTAYWLASHGWLSLLSYTIRTTCPGVALPPVVWTRPHQLLVKTVHHRLAYRSKLRRHFPIVVPSSQITLYQVDIKIARTTDSVFLSAVCNWGWPNTHELRQLQIHLALYRRIMLLKFPHLSSSGRARLSCVPHPQQSLLSEFPSHLHASILGLNVF